jgi:hypothetical protein
VAKTAAATTTTIYCAHAMTNCCLPLLSQWPLWSTVPYCIQAGVKKLSDFEGVLDQLDIELLKAGQAHLANGGSSTKDLARLRAQVRTVTRHKVTLLEVQSCFRIVHV